MSMKNRVQKLEKLRPVNSEGTQVAIFIVTPQLDPRGYECEGITILREPGESIQALQQRARQFVAWPPGTSQKIFSELE